MNRSETAGVVAALLVVLAALAAVPLSGASTAAPERITTQGDFDRTEFRITVYENGSARWTFLFKRTLSNDTERQEFETYAQNFNENETELYSNFQSRANSLVTDGQDVTGREMSASGFSKDAYVTGLNDNLGVVEMSFMWDGFAATDGNRVLVGDVFEGGLYVGPDQVLVVTHGDGLTFAEFEPQPDDRSDDTLTYRGERSFSDNRPRVVLAPPGAATSTPSPGDGGTPSDGGAGPGGSNGGGLGMLPFVALAIVLAVGGGAAYAYRAGMFGDDDGAAAASNPGNGGGGGAAGSSEPAPEPAISDEELLSDDDRVLKMLEERGGRMKQVKIVEETGWSKSKVSMLLSDMEEEGEISKLRVGRENIVSIAGQEPEAAGSPFKDEE